MWVPWEPSAQLKACELLADAGTVNWKALVMAVVGQSAEPWLEGRGISTTLT